MARITYVQPNGDRLELDVPTGLSVMQAALNSGVSGIIADCGGAAACATCHVYLDEAFAERMGPISEMEDQMLEAVACDRRPTSRLSCQIVIDDSCDGLVVQVPERQV